MIYKVSGAIGIRCVCRLGCLDLEQNVSVNHDYFVYFS